MHDAGKIIPGLLLFLAIVTFPIWYNLASEGKAERPELVVIPAEVEDELMQMQGVGSVAELRCVRDTQYMAEAHMDVLDEWRLEVVRDGDRIDTASPDGTPYYKSLTHTCLGCHQDAENFCFSCHDYSGVEPYCWTCHIDEPGGL